MLLLYIIYYIYKDSNLPIIVKKPYLELELSAIEEESIELVVLEQDPLVPQQEVIEPII